MRPPRPRPREEGFPPTWPELAEQEPVITRLGWVIEGDFLKERGRRKAPLLDFRLAARICHLREQ